MKPLLLAAVVFAATCLLAGPGAKEKVLLDTDIGVDIDDAVALAYLLAEPRCELVGITTVGGHPELRAEMASAICTAFGKGDVPIHPGEDRALVYPREPLDPKGARALGDAPRKRFANDRSAVGFMRKVIRANPGEITLVAVAPLTNVARLFQSDPEIPGLLKRLVVMGGRFFSEKPLPEWNVMCDPEATDAVFGPAGAANLPETVFFGLDVTLRTARPTDELLALCRTTKSLACLVGAMERYPADHEYYRTHPKPLHDPLACVALFHPEVCTYRRGRARFSRCGGDQVTVRLEEDAQGRQLAADTVDVANFHRILNETTRSVK